MAVTTGSPAPEIVLFDSDKNKVTLSALKGKNVLLLFFPQAFTGVCTKELCSVRDNIAQYNDVNATVLGISVDSVFTLARYKEEQKLNFPLLSDFNKEAITAYGCSYDSFTDMGMKGVAKRSAFVIDSEGTTRYAEILESAGDLPNFEAINTCLDTLK
jgi:glutaredoxin-dependent peroxiredoxin